MSWSIMLRLVENSVIAGLGDVIVIIPELVEIHIIPSWDEESFLLFPI